MSSYQIEESLSQHREGADNTSISAYIRWYRPCWW